jgi:two-component system, cell cycle sensor histidine kinase and response regulator CckA
VEDDETLRNLAIRMLRRLGYAVLSASHGAEAVSLAERRPEPIDLLMTDVVMPGMNGRELADRLARVHPEMGVLFTSGYTDDVILHTGVMERNLHFLGKPFSIQALSRSIREALDGRPCAPDARRVQ